MSYSTPLRSLGLLFYWGTMAWVLGQVAPSSDTAQPSSSTSTTLLPSQNQTTLQAYQAEQLTLICQEKALVTAGATPQQLETWYQQNAAPFALQEQRAEAMATTSALALRRTNRQPRIPVGASPALTDFLTTQAALANSRAQIHNQLVQQATASGQSPTFTQVAQMERQENQLFQQQNATLLTLQSQRSQNLANASTQTVRPVPGPVVLPPNATPQLTAFLTAQNQIRQGLAQIRNQYATSTPAARAAAMQQWYEQNAGLVAQMRQEAQNLSQASSATKN